MANITFQKPTDQPTGRNRLIEQLRVGLSNDQFANFRIMVAFAKYGPLARLYPDIIRWRAEGKRIEAIFGVDGQGTSKEALEFALDNFDNTYIAHVQGHFSSTFHPKLFLFNGDEHALAFLGSNNLTVGGTETNFESHTCFELDLPEDEGIYNDLIGLWDDALIVCKSLTHHFLDQLVSANFVVGEAQMGRSDNSSTASQPSPTRPEDYPIFQRFLIAPPSPLPPTIFNRRTGRNQSPPVQSTQAPLLISVQALVIQIVPHGNGEVLLSKRAIDQNPSFFGFPFTDFATPKRLSNLAYPQRLPDPVIKLRLYDITDNLFIEHDPFNLNTVYYSPKSEIRITVPQDIIRNTPDYSILRMQPSYQLGYDYEIDIYVPNSPQYSALLLRCNQTMPSGSRSIPRRYGWL